MILLKASLEIKSVFLKMIKTMGENVNWTEIFVITNNDIILAGKGRSLFFNFDNRRAFSNIVELSIEEDKIEPITQNGLLANTLNMILYAFGKWGGIKGLKVDMNYEQLNKLLNKILEEIDIEASLTKDNFRFYKNGVQMTYEDVIQAIIDKSKPEDEQASEEEPEENEIEDKKVDIGLWHNMRWTAGRFSFAKEELTAADREKTRLGHDFYMVKYKCPTCKEKLYMVIYPIGKEFRIETGEEAVYMSRAYTCCACNSFYTPKPHKMLLEGDVYNLAFEDDRVAYEDYLELLGRQGERTSNCNFNEYESEYNRINKEEPLQIEAICEDIDSMSEDEIAQLKDKMDDGFYSDKSVENYYDKVDEELNNRKNNKDKSKKDKKDNKENKVQEVSIKDKADKKNLKNKRQSPQDEKKNFKQELEKQELKKQESEKQESEKQELEKREVYKKVTQNPYGTKANSFGFVLDSKALESYSLKQLGDLKRLICSERGIDENEKKKYIDILDRSIEKEKEKELIQKVVSSKEKSYSEISRFMDEVKNEDLAESVKKPILESLKELMQKRGKIEVQNISLHIPEGVSKKQYALLKEKMEQYKDIDITPHIENLMQKRDSAEKQEIDAFVKRANVKERKSLFEVYLKLKDQDFQEHNVTPILEKLHDKIYAMDEAAIKKICPDPTDIEFDEGLQIYEEISSGTFLPELKVNVLAKIDKRLMKMKMDECDQLVKKLRKDMNWSAEEYPRIYFNEVRKMMRGDTDDADYRIIHNALNANAAGRGKYEYPILFCDASFFSNGGEGFVLTPDHIFYKGLLSSGALEVVNIENITADTGLLNKGICVNLKNTGKMKITNSLKSNNLTAFAKALNEFINYLKEKPESRNISYMAKEKHAVKCCYRCGYIYKRGNVCPKCGSKFNE